MKDILTGCYNRNAYDENLGHDTETGKSQVVTFDLNDLKYCNDTYGHQCGDKYLCDSATIIRSVYGRYGKVYRIGGDEFCILTGSSDKAYAERIAEKIRSMNGQEFEYDGRGIPLSLYAAVTAGPSEARYEELFAELHNAIRNCKRDQED